MGVARDLERRLERLVDGLASRLFRGRIHPVELGTLLVREADLAVVDTAAGPAAPNVFEVTLGGAAAEPDALRAAEDELAAFVAAAAANRGWRLEGPPEVILVIDPDRRASDATVAPRIVPGTPEPWAVLQPLDPRAHPLIVRHLRCLIGRSRDTDVRLTHDTVSRVHALLWQEAGAAWVADLGSSNGTFVNGQAVEEPMSIIEGDVIAFGDVGFTVREPQ